MEKPNYKWRLKEEVNGKFKKTKEGEFYAVNGGTAIEIAKRVSGIDYTWAFHTRVRTGWRIESSQVDENPYVIIVNEISNSRVS